MNAESNLLNVSEYMKDIMTAYLPIFEKQLNIMCNQAELIKSLIENTKLKVRGTSPSADDPNSYNGVPANQVKSDGVALTLKQPKNGNEAESKGHFLTLLSSIIATSKSLQSCVKNVYKELADIPLYFETYQNSITDYKNRNGVLPLMPLSQVSHLLNNQHRLVPAFDMPQQATITDNKVGGVSEPLLQTAIGVLRTREQAVLAETPTLNQLDASAQAADVAAQNAYVFAQAARNAATTANGFINTARTNMALVVAITDQPTAQTALLLITNANTAAQNAVVPAQAADTAAQAISASAQAADTAAQATVATSQIAAMTATLTPLAQATAILTTQALAAANTAIAPVQGYNAAVANTAALTATLLGEINTLITNNTYTVADLAAINISVNAVALDTTTTNGLSAQVAGITNVTRQSTNAARQSTNALATRLLLATTLSEFTFIQDTAILNAMDNLVVNSMGSSPQDQLSPAVIKGIRDDITIIPAAGGVAAHRRAAADPPLTANIINRWIGILTDLAKSPRVGPRVPRIPPAAGRRYKYYSCRGLIPHQDVGVGSDEFKFAYGTRGLLSDTNEPNVEMAPGVIGVLDIYNSKVGGAASYDKRKMVDSFVNSTHLLRFATDYIYHKTYLCNNDLDKLTEFYLVGTAAAVITPPRAPPFNLNNLNMLQHLSCQTGRHSFNDTDVVANGLIPANNEFFRVTSNITLLTENDNYKQSVYRMLRCIIDSNLSEHMHEQNRTQLRIYNILDSNIVPINFHALQREIALINIYNYSYTFDHMIKQFIGVETASRTLEEIKLSDDVPGSAGVVPPRGEVLEWVDATVPALDLVTKIGYYPEDALVRILIQPQGKRYVKDYVDNIWKLMAGNDSLSLNRPKYLSDQLWNKVLLNSLYSNAGVTGLDAVPNINRINVGNKGSNTSRTMQIGHMTRSDALDLDEPLDAPGPIDEPVNFGFEQITYIPNNAAAPNNKHDFTPVPVGLNVAAVSVWHNCGYARYQTIIVRYIEWFVHLQRVMRLLMRDQLTWVNDPIVHKSNALSNEITEYDSNNKFEMSDFE